MFKRLHPLLCLLLVVDVGPGVARSQVVGLTVLVAHTVVVFDAIIEEKLGSFLTGLPPVYALSA